MARWIGWSIAAVAAIALALAGFAGAVLCETAVRPARRPVPSVPDARTVEVTARDGVVLRAWLFTPAISNGDAVLVLHGIADSRTSQLGLARLFLANGYAVLVPDNRGQGESGGELVTYGLREADDVHRWVTWLIDGWHPGHVFGMGESLGGAILLQSLTIEPRFSAVVAEGSYANFGRIARDRVAQKIPRVLAVPAVWVGFLYARLRYGLDFRAASPEAVLENAATPVLLIHGLADHNTLPAHSEALAAKNSRHVTLWLVPGAGHTGAFGAVPREFEKRVLSWFAAYQNLPPGIQVREK